MVGGIEVDGQEIPLPAHSGILIAQHIAHKYYPKSSRGVPSYWKTSFIVFSGTLAAELGAFLGLDHYLYLPNLSDNLCHFLEENYDKFESDELQETFMQSGLIYDFLMYMKKNSYQPKPHMNDFGMLTRIRDYIQQHYDEPLTNETLTHISGYSTSYQNKMFRQQYGMTPLAYLAKYRLKMAKIMMMLQPEEQVQTVADNCGYNDISHFIQVFKDETGLTPLRFKKQFL